MPDKIEPSKLKRTAKPEKEEPEEKIIPVSAGEIGKHIADMVLNPSRDKMREMTIIDRIQGRFFPMLDMINMGWAYIQEIATYRQSPELYLKLYEKEKPIPPDMMDELLYRTAQWQKSVAGKNLEKAIDIVLAETESRAGEEDGQFNPDKAFEDK